MSEGLVEPLALIDSDFRQNDSEVVAKSDKNKVKPSLEFLNSQKLIKKFLSLPRRDKSVKSLSTYSLSECESGIAYGRRETSPDSEQIEQNSNGVANAKLCERGAISRRGRGEGLIETHHYNLGHLSSHSELDSESIRLMKKSTLIDSGSESGMTKNVKSPLTHSKASATHVDMLPVNAKEIPISAKMGTHVDMPPILAKAGFTLAEVLITLGIIGVVAAMTIPNLMTNYRKHVIETRLIKFYSTINQAIKLAEYDHDDMSGWDDLVVGFVKDEDGNDTDEPMAYAWVMKYIVPYLKSDAKKIGTDSQYVNLYFMDGSMVSVNRSSWIFFPDSSKYKPELITAAGQISVVGKYAFLFIFKPELDNRQNYKYLGQGLQPYKYGWDGTREDLLNGTYGCGKAGVIGAYCTELIRQNGWKIPNDYPIKL